jgi:CHAT domain-containing protein
MELNDTSIPSADPINRGLPDHQTGRRRVTRPMFVLSFVMASVGAVATVASVHALWDRHRLNETGRLLADAFGELRVIDMRFPGAGFAPRQSEAAKRSQDPPRALMEAEIAIGKSLRNDGLNPKWLRAEARAALFRRDYGRALEVLQRAQASKPDVSYNVDVALAHFERAESEVRGADYSAAAEALSKAIEYAPASAELRFNRAVVYERLFLYSQSMADWNEAIRLEPKGAWAGEARTRLAAIEKKTSSQVAPLTPRAYLALRTADFDPELALRAATETWLAMLGREDGRERTEALEAMRAISADLASKRGDRWLQELVGAVDHPFAREAFRTLARAVQANAAGHAADAAQLAAESETLFKKIQNRAGALYSSFEVNYAQQRAMRRSDCAVANKRLSSFIPRDYVWLSVQVWTEKGICDYFASDPGAAWADLDRAIQIARDAGYQESAIRPLSYQNEFRIDLGDSNGAWKASLSGLADVWSRPHDIMSPYHFYSGIVRLASQAGDYHTALAAKREGIVTVVLLKNPSLLALSHYQAATLALSAGDSAAAEHFKEAQKLYRRLPSDNQIRANLFNSGLGLAEAEVRAGNMSQAQESLREIAGEQGSFSDTRIQLRYQDLIGQINLKLGDLPRAATAFQLAHDLAVKDRQSLHDPRQVSLWMNTNRDFYRSLVDIGLREDPSGKQALASWREYIGHPIPAGIGLAISFVVLHDRTVAWLQEGARVTVHISTLSDAALANLTLEFQRAAGDPRTAIVTTRAAGQRLYQILLQPFAEHLHGRIWIEPDGPLAGLPWEALVTADGHWAGDLATYVVAIEGIRHSEVPSIGVQSRLLAVAASNGGREYQQDLPPLPGAAREAQTIGGMFRDAMVLTGNDATFDKVSRALPQAEIFHFAGHHGDTGLLLKEVEGRPGALDINAFAATAHPICRLAVLSACQTSTTAGGEEWDPDTLIRTLHRLGVPAVVASRWSVDSEVTADFMKCFYEALLKGVTVDVALQRASQTIRKRTEAAHPYYWAAFANFE